MTVSVCMGIYNGERYIEEQLKSILDQTRQADEVILCDDNSTDRTVEVIRRFIEQYHLENSWKLYQNRENKGYPRNFYYAMQLATTDVVFLSDQDDVWNEKKLELMCQVFEKEQDTVVLASKFGLIDNKDKSLHVIMTPSKSTETGNLKMVTLSSVLYKCEWPGMVLAYRREWYETRLGCLSEECLAFAYQIPHDFLLCIASAEDGGFRQLDMELACHRRHDDNVGKEEHRISKLLVKSRKIMEIEMYLDMLKNMENAMILCTPEGKVAHKKKASSMQSRLYALKSGKFRNVLSNALSNWDSVRLATVICDIMIVKQR